MGGGGDNETFIVSSAVNSPSMQPSDICKTLLSVVWELACLSLLWGGGGVKSSTQIVGNVLGTSL